MMDSNISSKCSKIKVSQDPATQKIFFVTCATGMESKQQSESFKRLECYKLTQFHVTDTILGHGSYANVLEVKYMGLKCAGKKIHDVLLQQGSNTYAVHRFEEECSLLSQI